MAGDSLHIVEVFGSPPSISYIESAYGRNILAASSFLTVFGFVLFLSWVRNRNRNRNVGEAILRVRRSGEWAPDDPPVTNGFKQPLKLGLVQTLFFFLYVLGQEGVLRFVHENAYSGLNS